MQLPFVFQLFPRLYTQELKGAFSTNQSKHNVIKWGALLMPTAGCLTFSTPKSELRLCMIFVRYQTDIFSFFLPLLK